MRDSIAAHDYSTFRTANVGLLHLLVELQQALSASRQANDVQSQRSFYT